MRDVSLVITFHSEGVLAGRTLDCVRALRWHSFACGVSIQLILVLDSATPVTKSVVLQSFRALRSSGDELLEVGFSDLGKARNIGFRHAQGTLGAVLDGDDFISSRWLVAAARRLAEAGALAIAHPQLVVEFGASAGVVRLPDQSLGEFPGSGCLTINPWVSTCVADIGLFRNLPYIEGTGRQSTFGYEDWHWNLEQIAAGRVHVTVPETMLLYRKKAHSLLAAQKQSRRIVPQSRFHEAEVLGALIRSEKVAVGGALRNQIPNTARAAQVFWAHKPRGGNLVGASVDRTIAVYRSFVRRCFGEEEGRSPLPDWALDQLRAMARLDPELPSSAHDYERYFSWSPDFTRDAAEVYVDLLLRLRQIPDNVVWHIEDETSRVEAATESNSIACRHFRGLAISVDSAAGCNVGKVGPVHLGDCLEGFSGELCRDLLVRCLLTCRPHAIRMASGVYAQLGGDWLGRVLNEVGIDLQVAWKPDAAMLGVGRSGE